MTQTPPDPQIPQSPAGAVPPRYSPPAYGQPTGYAMAAPMPQRHAADSRNILGILVLVAPFVAFSAVGIVLGHLGLSAVKKGTANNRGIARAGTIVSYVFTILVLVALLLLVAKVKPTFPHLEA